MAAESVLEHQHKLHEERENALVKEKSLKKPTVSIMGVIFQLMHTCPCMLQAKDQINCEHRMIESVLRSCWPCMRVRQIPHCTCTAHEYPHVCSMRKVEIASLGGPDEFGEFYRRLKTVKDYHRCNPNEKEEPMAMEFLRLDKQRLHPPDHLQLMVDFICLRLTNIS